MKKLFIYTLFLFIFVTVLTSTVSADIIPPDSHYLDRCIKVVNIDEFPDVALIGYSTGAGMDDMYEIENNKCLPQGYKFNTLSISWNTKDQSDIFEPENILLKDISPSGGYTDKNDPLVGEVIEYSMVRLSDDRLVLYKSKQISEYNDGTPKKIETFASPLQDTQSKNQGQQDNDIESISTPTPNIDKTNKQTDITPSPEPVKKGFWQSIICFFRGLFGKGC